MAELVSSEQLRSLMRLIGEAHEIGATERATHVIAAMTKIVGAAVGGSVTDCDFVPNGRGAARPTALYNWDSASLSTLRVMAERGSRFNPVTRSMMQRCPRPQGAMLTVRRRDVVADRDWYGSEFVQDHLATAQLEDALFSSRRTALPSVVQGIGFYREKGDRPFGEAERTLVEVFHAECWKLMDAPQGDVHATVRAQLAPRERETLDLLLTGLTDKEIAERLAISPFTVNQYNKTIYRRFGVNTRATLIARLLRSATMHP